MIGWLRGRLADKNPNRLVIDVGGIGYELRVSLSTWSDLPPAGDEIALHVHTHVREDALALFGFGSLEERAIFEHLLGVSGVGPKLALAVLSGARPAQIRDAIAASDVKWLTRIQGIGKKTAERIVIELRDKLGGSPQIGAPVASPVNPADAVGHDVISAMVNLGYRDSDAAGAVASARAELAPDAGFEPILKRALARLSRVGP